MARNDTFEKKNTELAYNLGKMGTVLFSYSISHWLNFQHVNKTTSSNLSSKGLAWIPRQQHQKNMEGVAEEQNNGDGNKLFKVASGCCADNLANNCFFLSN